MSGPLEQAHHELSKQIHELEDACRDVRLSLNRHYSALSRRDVPVIDATSVQLTNELMRIDEHKEKVERRTEAYTAAASSFWADHH